MPYHFFFWYILWTYRNDYRCAFAYAKIFRTKFCCNVWVLWLTVWIYQLFLRSQLERNKRCYLCFKCEEIMDSFDVDRFSNGIYGEKFTRKYEHYQLIKKTTNKTWHYVCKYHVCNIFFISILNFIIIFNEFWWVTFSASHHKSATDMAFIINQSSNNDRNKYLYDYHHFDMVPWNP